MAPTTPPVTGTPEIDVEGLAARQERAFVLDSGRPIVTGPTPA